jgi:hypothetical protein
MKEEIRSSKTGKVGITFKSLLESQKIFTKKIRRLFLPLLIPDVLLQK